ncbi:MAG: hypothetical protein IPN37_04310 [Betaproteobacteria bacterium]|nr:hypothetical protein [Betaproteobacteria bacterium]
MGATLDLHEAPALFERAQAKSGRRNLHRFFVHTGLPEISYPARPGIPATIRRSPALMDHFFNQHRTASTAWTTAANAFCIRSIAARVDRRAPRFPAEAWLGHRAAPPRTPLGEVPASLDLPGMPASPMPVTVLEISAQGFLARTPQPLPVGARCLWWPNSAKRRAQPRGGRSRAQRQH